LGAKKRRHTWGGGDDQRERTGPKPIYQFPSILRNISRTLGEGICTGDQNRKGLGKISPFDGIDPLQRVFIKGINPQSIKGLRGVGNDPACSYSLNSRAKQVRRESGRINPNYPSHDIPMVRF
jgi:hypothetical protein